MAFDAVFAIVVIVCAVFSSIMCFEWLGRALTEAILAHRRNAQVQVEVGQLMGAVAAVFALELTVIVALRLLSLLV